MRRYVLAAKSESLSQRSNEKLLHKVLSNFIINLTLPYQRKLAKREAQLTVLGDVFIDFEQDKEYLNTQSPITWSWQLPWRQSRKVSGWRWKSKSIPFRTTYLSFPLFSFPICSFLFPPHLE